MRAIKIVVAAIVVFAGCNRSELKVSGPLRQRGYLWQREWTPAVIDSLDEAARRMDGVVILGAEINFVGKKPEIIKTSIDWEAVNRQAAHCSVALRVAPFAGPFRIGDSIVPGDLNNGVIFTAISAASGPFGMPPARPRSPVPPL